MKAQLATFVSVLAALIAVSALCPSRLNAQVAPPGPIAPPASQQQSRPQSQQPVAAKPKPPQVPPRTTLAGPWKLNADDSDDPRQKVRSAENSGGTRNGGGNGGGYPGGGYPGGGGGYPGGGGGYPGGGYPGGGYPGGGYPGGGGGGHRNSGQDIESNPKMEALLRVSSSLTVDLKTDGGAVTSVVEVTDDELHKLTLYTDGRKLPQSTDETNPQVAAHWNGSQLVSDEKSPLGGKMSRTFELSFDGRQLIETLRIDNNKSKTPITIRYVYDVANSEQLTGEDSDPDRPVLKRHSDDAGTPTQ